MKMVRKIRITRELANMSKSEDKGICVFSEDDNMEVLRAQITGPEGTPYEKGVFKLEIIVPESYPFTPPSVKFLTKIYHPNIDESGRICLDLLQMPPKGEWWPSITIEVLLIAIRVLLENPNPDDPLMAEIAEEYKRNNTEFMRKAKTCTERFAR